MRYSPLTARPSDPRTQRGRKNTEQVGHHDIGGIPERGGGQRISLSVDDPRYFLPLGIGLADDGGLCVVGAIWLIAPPAFSIATADFAASATRK
jgi:hypothetical protein